MRGWPCWSAWKDAPAPAPSNSSPSLAQTALRPPSIVLDSCTSTPGWPCWSACLDAPAPAPSNSSPSLAPPALRPPSIVLDSCTSTRGWPCWSVLKMQRVDEFLLLNSYLVGSSLSIYIIQPCVISALHSASGCTP